MTPKNTPGLISYKIFNSSNKIYHLSLQELAGITQYTNTKNSCDQGLINLEPGHSCVLSLQVRAQELSGNKLAPLLCDYDQEHLTTGQCFEPAFEEKISIKELEEKQASFSMKVKLPKKINSEGLAGDYKRCFASFAGCTITLFVGSSAGGQLVLTNTSSVVLKNLRAYDLPTGVSQTASSNCAALAIGQKCTLNFSPGSTHNLGKTVSVKGCVATIKIAFFQKQN